MTARRRAIPLALLGVLVLVTAGPAAATAGALSTDSHAHDTHTDRKAPSAPGFFCDRSEAVVGRVFPEPEHVQSFVSYDDALCGLMHLEDQHPDRVRNVVVGESVGWAALTGGHDTFDVWVTEVTHFDAGPSFEEKPKIVFQLSIHGNEKGGREGGLRVIEDFARDIGLAAEQPELADLLDRVALVFVFPNPDGWTHQDPEYRHNDACYISLTCDYGERDQAGTPGAETQNFVRVNGNGVDLNREFPTAGWVRERYTPLSEPEITSLEAHLKAYTNVVLASDIHGMLNPADFRPESSECLKAENHLAPGACDPDTKGHFVLTMLPAGRQSPQEMTVTTTLAQRVKDTLNGNPYYAEWQALPAFGAWGGTFNEWGTVWDTLGYTDSGFTSDWFAQDVGLNVPGVNFELSYNHITFDNYYPGVAQRMNMYHVEAVRDIVTAFMQQADVAVDYQVETNGKLTAVLPNPVVVTNGDAMDVSGWAAENPLDDAYDAANVAFSAAPHDYWRDVKSVLSDAGAEGALDEVDVDGLTAGALAEYDNLVVAGSAYDAHLAGNADAVAAIRAFVEAGGNLFVTDSALQLLADLDLTAADAVARERQYAGFTNFVTDDHPFVENVRGLARETFEPTPLGFSLEDGGAAPVWTVRADAWEGEVLGVSGTEQDAVPDASRLTFGTTTLGDGRVTFLGALLPDPTLEHYAPYGVDAYATTYTGNQLVRNILGWTEVVTETPVSAVDTADADADAQGETDPQGIPAPGALAAFLIAGLAAIVLRRR